MGRIEVCSHEFRVRSMSMVLCTFPASSATCIQVERRQNYIPPELEFCSENTTKQKGARYLRVHAKE